MKKLVLALCAATMLAGPALAQMPTEPVKRDATYYMVVSYDFKEGKNADAAKIVDDYFLKASKAVGLAGPAWQLRMMTGPWDVIVAWKMDGGLAEGEWQVSANDVKWFKALSDVAGGAEQAQAKLDEFDSYVDHSASELAFIPN